MNLKKYIETFLEKPFESVLPETSTVSKDVYTKITSHVQIPDNIPYTKVGQDVYNDIEFFKSFSDIHPQTVFDQINTCALQGSAPVLSLLLKHPTTDVEVLKARQEILRKLEGKPLDFAPIQETEVLWLFDEIDPKLQDLFDMVFFRFKLLKPLNQHPPALTVQNLYHIAVSPIMGILTPILYVIVPYIFLSYKLKLNVPFKAYLKLMITTFVSGDLMGKKYNTWRIMSFVLTVFFYFQGIFNSVELSKTMYKISKFLVDKVNHVVSSLKHAIELIDAHWDETMATYFVRVPELKSTAEEKAYVESLSTLPFDLKSNFGQQLHTYYTFNRPIIQSIVTKTYLLDALCSLARFKVSYTDFKASSRPSFELTDTYHPCIDAEKVVKNTVKLGNIILTGPNAGGKSTFIKSILVNAILSQTAGIAIASKAQLTPFSIINSQINIPDSKGFESLFEAEMYRCKDKLDQMKQLPSNEHALFIMDEIFNSTNPVEGMAGAYAIAKKLSDYDNCLILFTTHYAYLTRLQKTGKFANYKMNVIQENDTITFPYKLSRGISKQYIALDLLAKNGFDEDIINEAQHIKRVLTNVEKSPESKNVQD